MEHSAILSTFIKLPIKIFVLSIFELPLKTGFTVLSRQGITELLISLCGCVSAHAVCCSQILNTDFLASGPIL